MDKISDEMIEQLANLIAEKTLYIHKEVLTSDEAARYMGISRSYLYKLTMRMEVPHYKPRGKMCYYNRKDLDNWLQTNRISSRTEIEDKARAYCWAHPMPTFKTRKRRNKE
ncbi:MAG: helix-turn-helix domain-containing protein [Porphyromonadaceae bacterium]|nr:helix-turn-helix domain-containing protein [Porphyromonadaceae bacterium]